MRTRYEPPVLLEAKNPQFAAHRSSKSKERGRGRARQESGTIRCSCCISFSSVTSASRRSWIRGSAVVGKLSNHDVSPFPNHTSRTRSSGGLHQPNTVIWEARCYPSCSSKSELTCPFRMTKYSRGLGSRRDREWAEYDHQDGTVPFQEEYYVHTRINIAPFSRSVYLITPTPASTKHHVRLLSHSCHTFFHNKQSRVSC
jgi:hypothetical protein